MADQVGGAKRFPKGSGLGSRKQQVGRAGEHFVAAELNRRGIYAVTFAGNMPNIDILASNVDLSRTVAIQVKTKTRGTWQVDSKKAMEVNRLPDSAGTRFWVFVDLLAPPSSPEYFIVPETWMLDDIDRLASAYRRRYRKEHGDARISTHHAIARLRIEEWRERWDLLSGV